MNAQTDYRQVKENEKRLKKIKAQLLDDWRKVLRTPEGKRVVLHILESCGLFRSTWEPSAAIHKNEGMRIVGLGILETIKEADVQVLAQLLAEPFLREAEERLARSKPEQLSQEEESNAT
jgi:hypothetical protein